MDRIKCPFVNFKSHQSTGGCAIEYTYGRDSTVCSHIFYGLRVTPDTNGAPLFAKLGIDDRLNNKPYREVKFLTSGRASVTMHLALDENVKYITDCIDTPTTLLRMFRGFIKKFDDIINATERIYGERLYPSEASMQDIIYNKGDMVMMRPVRFHTDEICYYKTIIEFFSRLYHGLLNNTTVDYTEKMKTGKRNIMKCTLKLHKNKRLLAKSFECSAGCKKSCVKYDQPTFVNDGQHTRKILTFCYGMLPTKSLPEENEKYEFKCIFELRLAKLHYELFGRDIRMHTILCCPATLLNADWYAIMKKWIDDKLDTIHCAL